MPIPRIVRTVLYVLFAATVALAQTGDELTHRLDDLATAYQQHRHFMGSVLVAKGGHILLEKGYGMADLEWSVPNTPDARFRIGSMTKQFTATAIMQLAEQHKLSVQDHACKYFDQCPDAWKQITVHQLLSHTSGIPSYTDNKQFATPPFLRLPKTPAEILLWTKDKPLEFEPGTKWMYSNSGYIFLGIIVEKVSGEKYASYLQKHIFEPLGMLSSGYDETNVVLPHRASGYQPCGQSICNSDYIDMSLPYAAGSLYSTVGDLYKWDRALYTAKVLSKASLDLMFTPVRNEYGYGWMLGPMANHKQIGHGGGIPGFSSYIARFPDDDAAVIVLSNNIQGNAAAVAAALAGTLFGERVDVPHEMKPITLPPAILDRYTGKYQVGPMVITFTDDDGHFMVAPQGQPKIEAKASSENQFFIEAVGAVFTFTVGPDGKTHEVKMQEGPATLTGQRIN